MGKHYKTKTPKIAVRICAHYKTSPPRSQTLVPPERRLTRKLTHYPIGVVLDVPGEFR